MENEHFEEFASLITGLYRGLQKLKDQYHVGWGMKSVHVFWVYLLRRYPEGLTATELSKYSMTNRSLISREINELENQGYVTTDRKSNRRRYGWKFLLTEKGMEVAEEIGQTSMEIQKKVNAGISEEDLAAFYRVSKILLENFDRISEESPEE